MPPAAAAADSTPPADGKKKIPMVVPVRSNRGNITCPLADDNWKVTGELLLFPGPNMVDADKWARAKKQPMVQALLAEKIKPMRAEEFTKTLAHTVGKTVIEEGKPVPAAAPLSGMSDSEAIELVADCGDQTLLTMLRQAESRVAVRKAIEARIEVIRNPEKAGAVADAAGVSTKAQISTEG